VVLLDTLNATRLQTAIPAGGVGRAFGLLNTLAAVWAMAGSIVPALVAATYGAPAAVVVAAVVVLVLGGSALWGDRPRANGQRSRCCPTVAPGASA
jgi:MFS-type transporter involved in bile tolerance (Atg22 family)